MTPVCAARRLSRRGRDEGSSSTDPRGGADNVAFEMDQPKVPLQARLSSRSDSKQSSRALGLRRGSNLLDVPQSSLDLPAGPPSKRPLERTISRQSNASSISISSTPRASLADGDQPSFQEQFKRIRQAESRRSSSQSDISSGSSLSDLFRGDPSRFSRQLLEVPVESCPAGADVTLHPPLEKRDSRSSNIIVFHTQDARGQLTR